MSEHILFILPTRFLQPSSSLCGNASSEEADPTSHLFFTWGACFGFLFALLALFQTWLTVLFSCQSPVPESFAEYEEVSSDICPS